ncbi:MAG: hypothetical protein WDN26_22485 [Chitinophagaceae bacterium]
MNKSLHYIQQKSEAIQDGLLRFRDKQGDLSLLVKTSSNEEDSSLNCILTDPAECKKLMNRKVNLVQKRNDDYLYISGKVSAEVTKGSKILSIHILKACWFERKSKGGVSWLSEKYIYENMDALATA